MKKIIIISVTLLIFFVSLSILIDNKDEKEITVASCPTFYYMLDKIDDIDWVNTIKSGSTAESLEYYKKGEADVVISGRPLSEDEPKLLAEKIGRGYDFIFMESFPMWEEEMELITFYTNLDKQQIIDDFQYITEDNILKLEGDVEDYITESVVITILDDHMIGGTANIFKSDQSRVRMTRLPRIYYDDKINKNKIVAIKETIKE